MATFLTKRSGKRHIQSEVVRIMNLCQRLNIRIIRFIFWVTTLAFRQQTMAQRQPILTTGKWTSKHTRIITSTIKFTIDFFASDRNKKSQKIFQISIVTTCLALMPLHIRGKTKWHGFAHLWEKWFGLLEDYRRKRSVGYFLCLNGKPWIIGSLFSTGKEVFCGF